MFFLHPVDRKKENAQLCVHIWCVWTAWLWLAYKYTLGRSMTIIDP